MMKLACALLLLLAAGCSAPAPGEYLFPRTVHAARPRFVPGPGPYKFECDTDAGQYSEQNAVAEGPNLKVTGVMQVVAGRPSPQWPPDAGIVIAGDSHYPRVGLESFVLPDKPFVLQLAVRGTGGPGDHTVFATVPLTDAAIPVTLVLREPGQLSVSVGEATTMVAIGEIEVTRINLYCSSSYVRFFDVTTAPASSR
jgi:hypothetical protein